MELIRPFNKLGRHDAALAGGKGASLGEMTQAGIPVPPGYVVLSDAFERFIEETDLDVEIDSILHKVNHEEIHTVENASEQIKALILGAEMPKDIALEIINNFKQLNAKFVAVRSSATAEDSSAAAWAGQLESYLNTTESSLLEKVKHCWASLFTPRAIFYRFEKGLHNTKISVAVVVQKMVNSEVSGIAFSVHPVTQDYNQIIIEAGLGLGESIVSGQITPDSYVIEKEPRRIIDKNVAEQEKGLYKKEGGGNEWRTLERGKEQKLSDKEILDLSELILKIEKHYGFPCDIEWAQEAGKFYIVQSRPITTLTDKQDSKEQEQEKLKKKNDLDSIKSPKPSWVKKVSRDISLTSVWYAILGHSKFMKEVVGFNFDNLGYYYNGEVVEGIKDKNQLLKLKEFLSKLKDNEVIDLLISFKRQLDKRNQLIKEFTSLNLLKLPKKEILTYYRKFHEHYPVYWGYHVVMFFIMDILDSLNRKEFLKQNEELLNKLRNTNPYLDVDEKLLANLYNFISKEEDIPVKKLYLLLPEEIVSYLSKDSKIDIDKIKAREKGFLVLSINGEIILKTDLEARDYFREIFPQEQVLESQNSITGQIAFKGQAKGRAVVVKRKDEFSKIKKGDVLVCSMTTIDYVPYLNKVSAIVTDEGGIGCHAAIVSRELKKPCIIGTKNATQVFKDGDELEVDADTGVVRILKRSSEKGGSEQEERLNVINGTEWKLAVTRNMSFFHNVLNHRGGALNTKDFGVDKPYRGLFVTIDGTRTSVFIEPVNYSAYAQAVMDAFSTKKKIAEIKNKYNVFAEEALEALEAINKELNPKTWSRFVEAYQKFTAGLAITTHVGRFGTDKLIQLLKNQSLADSEIPHIVSEITYPSEHTPLFDSRLALMEIGSKIQKKKTEDLEVELKEWLEDYSHIPVNYCDEPWNMEDAKAQLSLIMQKDCSQELKKAKEQHEQRIKRREQLIKKIGNPDVEILSLALAEATYLNEFRKNVFCKLSFGYRGVFAKIAALGGSDNWRDCFYLLPEEMAGLLEGKKIRILDLVKKRRLLGVYINEKDEEIILDQKSLEGLEKFIQSAYSVSSKTSTENTDSIKGFTANRGMVKGVAKVILSSRDFHKLQLGEILVTTMTSIDFVPIMQKAAAFVTNEGGITCHASIVAREMNKPCIIGTQIATKLINDGDLVEVDATNGVVRILKRGSN